MADSLLTERLHISGLTPSLTPTDLERRLSSFGRVKAMDGFGARDGLGDPRKFGFVTMEISEKGLEKCLNALSGTTWKGAKLRIGEAKPDFRERVAQINAQPPRPIRPQRIRARNYGYPSSTLPLAPLSATAAASTPGWIVTPSGRVVRPMKMRPERPLEPMRTDLSAIKAKLMNGKGKKRVKPPLARARRRLIDPTKWDSVYLKGVYLDAVPVPAPASKKMQLSPNKHDIVVDEGTEDDDLDSDAPSVAVDQETLQISQQARQPIRNHVQLPLDSRSQKSCLATSSRIDEPTESVNVSDETDAALAILGRIFEGKEDWEGKESAEDMDDVEDHQGREKAMHAENEDIRTVPCDPWGCDSTGVDGKERSLGEGAGLDRQNGVNAVRTPNDDVVMAEIGTRVSIEAPARTAEATPQTNLKALFAPREEASFSLLDHLDPELDLELEADILGIGVPSDALQDNLHLPEPLSSTSHANQVPSMVPTTKNRSSVKLNPSHPLLFPPLDSLPFPHAPSNPTSFRRHDTPTCFLFPSMTRACGLHPLPPSYSFTRSPQDTPVSVRERWEKDKSSLTREWKKAWREARGNKRGKGEAAHDIGGGY